MIILGILIKDCKKKQTTLFKKSVAKNKNEIYKKFI